jgi:hypothetical protein
MAFPKKEELPISADPLELEIDQARIDLFQKSFKNTHSQHLPPTWGAVGLQGIFALLNRFEVDWKKLLHATQKFEYGEKPSIPFSAKSETKLVDVKYRAQIYWLSFEGTISDQRSNSILVKTKTLILVRE